MNVPQRCAMTWRKWHVSTNSIQKPKHVSLTQPAVKKEKPVVGGVHGCTSQARFGFGILIVDVKVPHDSARPIAASRAYLVHFLLAYLPYQPFALLSPSSDISSHLHATGMCSFQEARQQAHTLFWHIKSVLSFHSVSLHSLFVYLKNSALRKSQEPSLLTVAVADALIQVPTKVEGTGGMPSCTAKWPLVVLLPQSIVGTLGVTSFQYSIYIRISRVWCFWFKPENNSESMPNSSFRIWF